MDFLLFFIGLFALLRNNLASTIAIIFILTSTYLQLPVISGFWVNFLFPHNVSDIGLLLYVFLFIKAIGSGKFHYKTPITKPIMILVFFLTINGIYDILGGTSVLDVINFLKLKFLLSIVFISSMFKKKTIARAYKYVFYVTIALCILQIVDRVLPIGLVEMSTSEDERGAKPVFSVMLFALFPIINMLHQRKFHRVIYGIILILPIILNMKMTYAGTVILSVIVYVFLNDRLSKAMRVKSLLAMSIVAVGVSTISGGFSARFDEMTREKIDLSSTSAEGNFSYRILHAYERCNYICQTPKYALRGIGYVSEKNFRKEPFLFGQYNDQLNKVSQLDTGDIAWSLFFLRYGFLGIAIYLYFYFSLINQFRQWNTSSKWKNYWVAILVTFIIFTSLGNTVIEGYYFFIFPILFFNVYCYEYNSYNLLLQYRRNRNHVGGYC